MLWRPENPIPSAKIVRIAADIVSFAARRVVFPEQPFQRADAVSRDALPVVGDGRFIHDTTRGHPGVQISVLDEEPWKALHVASRRVK